MHADNERAVKALNDLIETTLDSVHGYRHAAEGASNPELKSMFRDRANQREELGRRLQADVRNLGGEPEDDQSLLGRIHNKFAELRGELMGRDDSGVIAEVERGEDVIKARFEEAAKDASFPETLRQRISAEYATIKADHDAVSSLKHRHS
ncbi:MULTISPECIES: ferritin-like domain-containing protein [unclassified Brevundimonas]|uniref:ferritin-like domain-containing protein n=1 Tax=unclassified Brevundimonas TaxID=2622653 RepID=UPI0025BC76CD|nr:MULTISPECIES: PA2169 family four-helix-bundle protein [unclassified Brevundimonas]